jgi:hypothetical protein
MGTGHGAGDPPRQRGEYRCLNPAVGDVGVEHAESTPTVRVSVTVSDADVTVAIRTTARRSRLRRLACDRPTTDRP